MAILGYWRTGNTRPGIKLPIALGNDPLTGAPRVLDEADEVTMIMRNDTVGGPAQVRTVEVLTTDPPVGWWKPEDGDFDDAGTYRVVFDVTDADGDVETIPDEASSDYSFLVTAKPGDEDV